MSKIIKLIFLIVLLLGTTAYSNDIDRLLDAMIQVESGGDDKKISQAGRARGCLQITDDYWSAARMSYGRHAGDPEGNDCHNRAYSKQVVLKYWERNCPNALRLKDLKHLARTHAGGIDGPRQEWTLKYWEKVELELKK